MIVRIANWVATKTPAYKSLQNSHSRYSEITRVYANGLREIVDAVDGTRAPNGTARKLRRVAASAFHKAAEI